MKPSVSISAALAFIFATLASAVLESPIKKYKFQPHDVIECDVVILGGGATGVYAAARILDANKTIVLIEKTDRISGHVNTYSPPGSSVALDYGVMAYLDLPGVREFFRRFSIELIPTTPASYQSQYVDFNTGLPITTGIPGEITSNPQSVQQALGTYGQLAAQYLNQTFPSLSQLPIGQPLPEDLSLPFGDFVKKYNLQAAIPAFYSFLSFIGDIFGAPTAYALNQFSAVHLNAAINQSFLLPNMLNNSVLYERAAKLLGDKVLLTSTVAFADRTNSSITLVVTSSADDSPPKLIKAKKLVNTIPPILANLASLNLDQRELSIFQHWLCQSAYVGVLGATGLPDGLELVNFSPNASVLNLPGVDGQPHVCNIVFSGFPGLYRVGTVGGPDLTADGAKALVYEATKKIAQAGTYNMTDPHWLAFASHTPLQCRFDGENIKAGLYAQAFALNGYRSTFYAGAAWASDYTSVHWTYLESVILPRLFKALEE